MSGRGTTGSCFHAALVPSVLSGLVDGQMGDGSVEGGVKPATTTLGVTHVVFLVLESATLLG